MPARLRSLGLGLVAASLIPATVGHSRSLKPSTVAAETLQAAGLLRWYRGNLHTHSHWSDDDDISK